MEAFIGLRSQGGVPVTQGSDLKKKMLRHLVSPKGVLLMVLLDLFKVSRMNNFNHDLFKVSKMTNFNNDLFKVSKMTNFNYDQFKVGKTTNSNYDLFKVSKMYFLKLGCFFYLVLMHSMYSYGAFFLVKNCYKFSKMSIQGNG